MTTTSMLLAWVTSNLGSLLIAGAVAAQPPAAPTSSAGGMGRVFAAGLNMLGLVFKGIGRLAGRPAAGAVWRVNIRTGEQRRIGHADDLAWPVPSPDGTAVYALRGRQVVRIAVADGFETPLGAPADWRKLLGVVPDGTLLGFVNDDPRPPPALLASNGVGSPL